MPGLIGPTNPSLVAPNFDPPSRFQFMLQLAPTKLRHFAVLSRTSAPRTEAQVLAIPAALEINFEPTFTMIGVHMNYIADPIASMLFLDYKVSWYCVDCASQGDHLSARFKVSNLLCVSVWRRISECPLTNAPGSISTTFA